MTSFALKLQVLLLPLSSKALRLQPLPHRLALASVDTLFAYSIAQALHLNYAPDTIWNFILFCSLSKTICSLLKYVPHETRNLLNTGGHDWNRTSGCDEGGRFTVCCSQPTATPYPIKFTLEYHVRLQLTKGRVAICCFEPLAYDTSKINLKMATQKGF